MIVPLVSLRSLLRHRLLTAKHATAPLSAPQKLTAKPSATPYTNPFIVSSTAKPMTGGNAVTATSSILINGPHAPHAIRKWASCWSAVAIHTRSWYAMAVIRTRSTASVATVATRVHLGDGRCLACGGGGRCCCGAVDMGGGGVLIEFGDTYVRLRSRDDP